MEKDVVLAVIGAIGAAVAGFFGGWTTSLTTLVVFMAIDYITGVIMALVFKKSAKTDTGGYSSTVGMQGIFKKVMTIILVYMGHRIDIELGCNYIRDFISIAFIVNEAVSIAENCALMGLPVPDILVKSLDILKKKGSTEESDEK
ncbi:MAG: phage holin family protein [Lachnospiraceae bacterium]|nr:phage holin family protein [Lachnospiraceae bacterium]